MRGGAERAERECEDKEEKANEWIEVPVEGRDENMLDGTFPVRKDETFPSEIGKEQC